MEFIFITGNDHKVKALERWLGRPVKHKKVDLDELQVLDDEAVVRHKAEQAYKLLGTPVLVEDVYLAFNAMGRLPGTYIKWFLEEIGTEGLCKLLDGFTNRSATARVTYAFYDGLEMRLFQGEVKGSIAPKPIGSGGFGWNSIFIPDGHDKTYGELDDEKQDTEFANYSVRNQAVQKLKAFLDKTNP